MSKECLEYTDDQGSLLHAVIRCNWKKLKKHISGDFFKMYEDIINVIVNGFPGILDVTNNTGESVLHCWIRMMPDIDHYAFLELVNMFKSPRNIEKRNFSGQTVLHELASKVGDVKVELFQELLICLTSSRNILIQDKDGRTLLHVLAANIPFDAPSGLISTLEQCFGSPTLIDIKDNLSQTALHILAERYSMSFSEAFLQLLDSVAPYSNVNTQDRDELTVLHILMKVIYTNPLQASASQMLLKCIYSLTSEKNVNAVDKDSLTPYSWVLLCHMEHARTNSASSLVQDVQCIFLNEGANEDLAKMGLRTDL